MKMIAYKALDADYKSTFQGFAWPLPKNLGTTSDPGPWIELEGKPTLCQRGFHGWIDKKKAFLEGAHVYLMEFEGETVCDHEKICGVRARLVEEIFQQPQIKWEEIVNNKELSAFDIIEAARQIRLDLHTVDLRKFSLQAGYYPVVPAYHIFRTWNEFPDKCGDCGLNQQLHDGWEARKDLAATFDHYDRYELLLFIQQILAGKAAF
jgi:hypothetical protein